MTKGLFAATAAIIRRLFPERQFYHRSDGQVHFVALSGQTQVAYLVMTLGFLTWVGYASVNVVFKEQIISEKERDAVAMQKRYEQRINDLQQEYDKVNNVLVVAEERFRESTRQLEQRHEQLESLVDLRQAMNDQSGKLKQTHFAKSNTLNKARPGSNTVLMRVTELEPTSRQSRRSEIEEENPVEAVTTALGQMIKTSVTGRGSRNSLESRVATLENRVEKLRGRQNGLVYAMQEESQERSEYVAAIIANTGLDFEEVYEKFEDPERAIGGPLVEISDMDTLTVIPQDYGDNIFRKQIYRLANELEHLSVLEAALNQIPLINPLNDVKRRRTSGFGPRIDPFSRRRAFHSGMDWAGPRGSDVVAAASGLVTFAKSKGPYGNMVELDHGHGFKTRYGHLRKILVKKGEMVDFYQKIATVGSTGRSTGPHLHYEIVFNNKVKDPEKFIEAGNYVFKE